MDRPRRKIVMALSGSDASDLTHDELMVYEMVCHLEACAISALTSKLERRAAINELPINMQAPVQEEAKRIFEFNSRKSDER